VLQPVIEEVQQRNVDWAVLSSPFVGGYARESILTLNNQTYQSAVSLRGDVSLQSGSGNVGFGGTVNSAVADANSLSVNAAAAIFDGSVGGTGRLESLFVFATTTSLPFLAAPTVVRTSGTQQYFTDVSVRATTTVVIVAVFAVGLTGYGSGPRHSRNLILTLLMSMLIAAVIMLIVDLHRPTRGNITLDLSSFGDLRDGMAPAPAAPR
jgi:hypothetical protein